jgi:hypothetical protein
MVRQFFSVAIQGACIPWAADHGHKQHHLLLLLHWFTGAHKLLRCRDQLATASTSDLRHGNNWAAATAAAHCRCIFPTLLG